MYNGNDTCFIKSKVEERIVSIEGKTLKLKKQTKNCAIIFVHVPFSLE